MRSHPWHVMSISDKGPPVMSLGRKNLWRVRGGKQARTQSATQGKRFGVCPGEYGARWGPGVLV
jgi:hypothetical protein